MIVVKLEMWPHGDETKKRELGRTYIFNDGTGSVTRGNYEARVCRKNKFEVKTEDLRPGTGFARKGQVTNYPRMSYNVWRLILRALRSCFPEES
jgi:hypothetical protein